LAPNKNIIKPSKVQRAERRLERAITNLEGMMVNSEVNVSEILLQPSQAEIKIKDLIDKNSALKEVNNIVHSRLEAVIKRLKSALGKV
jgi:hypothetical protein